MAGPQSSHSRKPAKSPKPESGTSSSRQVKLGDKHGRSQPAMSTTQTVPPATTTSNPNKLSRMPVPTKSTASSPPQSRSPISSKSSKTLSERAKSKKPKPSAPPLSPAEAADLSSQRPDTDEASTPKSSKKKAPRLVIDISQPERIADLGFILCLRGRKFGRARFASLVQERIASSEATERFVTHIPIELVALFFAREVRPVSEDRAPVNECFELPDGGMLEFVGDHMEAAETIARLLLVHDEQRLEHVVEQLTEHERSWLHTLAVEARDARLTELGFPDLDDVDRLFAPWHAQLLVRKLQAWTKEPSIANGRPHRTKISPDVILSFVQSLPSAERLIAIERLHYLALCQAVQDNRRSVSRMNGESMSQATETSLKTIARGLQEAGGNLALLASPQISTVYRLGLAIAGQGYAALSDNA